MMDTDGTIEEWRLSSQRVRLLWSLSRSLFLSRLIKLKLLVGLAVSIELLFLLIGNTNKLEHSLVSSEQPIKIARIQIDEILHTLIIDKELVSIAFPQFLDSF